jgi:hypothetical protein
MEYLNEVKINGIVYTNVLVNPKYVMFKLKSFKKYSKPLTTPSGKIISGKSLLIDCKAFTGMNRHVLMSIAARLTKGDEIYVRGELSSWFKKSPQGMLSTNYYIQLLEINQPKPKEEFIQQEDEVTQRVLRNRVMERTNGDNPAKPDKFDTELTEEETQDLLEFKQKADEGKINVEDLI